MNDERDREAAFFEVQHFRQGKVAAWLAPTGTAAFICLGYLVWRQLPFSPQPAEAPASLSLPAIIGSLVYLLGFGIFCFVFYVMKMETEVSEGALHIRFFPLIKKTISLGDIRRSEVRTYRPIREYGGWGIRSGLGNLGGAYNVSGNRGVQLEFLDGQKLLLGSQRAEELNGAIHANSPKPSWSRTLRK
jgi:hypothetical protein